MIGVGVTHNINEDVLKNILTSPGYQYYSTPDFEALRDIKLKLCEGPFVQ